MTTVDTQSPLRLKEDVGWQLRVAAPAAGEIAEVRSKPVAVIEFITGALLENPHRVGSPLRDEFIGRYAARRGTFRIVYRVDEDQKIVEVIDVAHRADIYRTWATPWCRPWTSWLAGGEPAGAFKPARDLRPPSEHHT